MKRYRVNRKGSLPKFFAYTVSCLWLLGVSVATVAAPETQSAGNNNTQPLVYSQYTQDGSVDRNTVIMLAKQLAQKPYQAPQVPLSDSLKNLSLAQYQNILFQPNQALWAQDNLPFQMQLFMRGSYFDDPVEIGIVDGGHSTHLPYSPDYFVSGSDQPLDLPKDDIGFSGFSLYYRLNQPQIYNKAIQFQGASYFQAIGKGETWGASARGLAINTADPKGEEVPRFRAFWVSKPSVSSNSLVVNALLDSPSVTGAYRFTIRPGDSTNVDVEVALFPRQDLSKVGLSPMNSMYMFSGNDRRGIDDYRPQVHNSDGLLMVNGKGERLWRPLANPTTLQISGFVDDAPIGFGLMQRDRKFADYQDLVANFQDRPSLWVEPIGNWGQGSVTLIEIPSDDEIHANIVAYWSPKQPLKAETEYDFSYRLHWGQAPHPAINEYVVSSTISGHTKGAANNTDRHFVVDYTPTGNSLPADGDVPTINVTTTAGAVKEVQVVKNPHTKGYRLSFDLEPGDARAAELRAELSFADSRKAETWLYRWTAK
ncbi:glucan biosynthesis protein G [Celerinatantimonas sp. YJH-8]|uniref:glucan biosynthesis protein G n=1 Tax=Celerinatantimonas sp. YJH-8 TaxID=3228714 RepID=UPI0038C83E55